MKKKNKKMKKKNNDAICETLWCLSPTISCILLLGIPLLFLKGVLYGLLYCLGILLVCIVYLLYKQDQANINKTVKIANKVLYVLDNISKGFISCFVLLLTIIGIFTYAKIGYIQGQFCL